MAIRKVKERCSAARSPCRQETLLLGGVWHQVTVVPDDEVEIKGMELP